MTTTTWARGSAPVATTPTSLELGPRVGRGAALQLRHSVYRTSVQLAHAAGWLADGAFRCDDPMSDQALILEAEARDTRATAADLVAHFCPDVAWDLAGPLRLQLAFQGIRL